MGQAYYEPERESDPHALPDIETFEVERPDPSGQTDFDFTAECGFLVCQDCGQALYPMEAEDSASACCGALALTPGWYWWPCFPGCLPDGEPVGPFESEGEALEDARD